MLQLSNLDEGKSDWISETQLIIPMVDNEEIQAKEMDGLSKHAITLNALEGTDQNLLPNGNGHAFVIGLDRTLFENYNNKTDLLLMPNSDLKLLPSVSDSKLTYSLPSIDQSKNDIVWENTQFEKPLSKDILNVIQDTSKSWKDMGKSTGICLEEIASPSGNENKINSDFLIEPQVVNQPVKVRNENSEQQYIVGYYPVVETCDAVLVPASLMALQQKTVDNTVHSEKTLLIENDLIKTTKNLDQLFVNASMEESQTAKWIKPQTGALAQGLDSFIHEKLNNEGRISLLKINNTPENSLILTEDNINKLNETVIPLVESTSDVIETKSKNDIYNEIENFITKDEKYAKESIENENNTLPEQSLPLKKKAKMKKSPVMGNYILPCVNSSNITSKGFNVFENVKDEVNHRPVIINMNENLNESNSDSDELLSNQNRKTKSDGASYNFKKKKKKLHENLGGKDEEQWKSNIRTREKVVDESVVEGCDRPFESVIDLLEQLKHKKYINHASFKILETGLREMDVDILKEMYTKRETKSNEYSSHLKAFALMLHFRQPAAYIRLGRIFQNGWPPLSVIKDWKRRLNNHRKQNLRKHKVTTH